MGIAGNWLAHRQLAERGRLMGRACANWACRVRRSCEARRGYETLRRQACSMPADVGRAMGARHTGHAKAAVEHAGQAHRAGTRREHRRAHARITEGHALVGLGS